MVAKPNITQVHQHRQNVKDKEDPLKRYFIGELQWDKPNVPSDHEQNYTFFTVFHF
jgi:hypothetical protein